MPGTSALGVMSADTFANRTKATKAVSGFSSHFKSRGSNMSQIDSALKAWEKNCAKNIETAQKLALVHRIGYECQRWLDRKRGKSSRLANYRRQTIEELVRQCRKAAQMLTGKVRGEAGNRPVVKSLDKNYSYERQHYLEIGKSSNPYAAGAVSHLDTKTYNEFKTAAEQEKDNRVYYFNRAERMQYMAYIEGGLFYEDGGLIHCTIGPGFSNQPDACARMYAVDRYGNMFTKEIRGFTGTFFNHSSFCAGREVMCAGTALWIEGELKFISNNSGHYKPTPAHLQSYLWLLAEEDVDLDELCVVARYGNVLKEFKGSTFAGSTQAQPDWPHKDNKGVYFMHEGRKILVDEPKG